MIPGKSVLRNLIGIDSAKALSTAEADLVNARTIQLMDSENTRLPNSRDFKELSAIHFHLFQDIYDWAGKLRTIDMRRGDGEFFAPCIYLERNLISLSSQLAEKNFLRIKDRSTFIRELTYFYDHLNWIHPFREGNGRTQRHFWSRVSADAGWILDWRPIHGELDEASRQAREDEDFQMLYSVFEKVVATSRT
ncbi:cell filamentation protein [Corynebacterium callunae DSM 20147]|uniref:protein adenylyltransferase n=1 Tax=Corynebacterium callunae DSM 20147 TaxID=1121353 RepID=M1UD76_9CORY|nr:cell filamentation protein [Corynebacterium callunae DSM 20147]